MSHRPAERPRTPPLDPGWVLYALEVPVGRSLYRIGRLEYPDPAYFGRACTYRFDDPDKRFGVCYLGTTFDAAFVEAVPTALLLPTGERLVRETALVVRYAARATTTRVLRLAHFAGDGLVHNAVDQRVTGGDDYTLSRAWAKAVHRDHPDADGIYYPSRHHSELHCVALFERARTGVQFEAVNWGRLGDTTPPDLAATVARVLRRFRVRVEP